MVTLTNLMALFQFIFRWLSQKICFFIWQRIGQFAKSSYGLLTLITKPITCRYYCPVKMTQQQYEKIADSFPRQRGNVTIDNLTMLNAILHILEHGCKWRGIPNSFGNWHSIYTRMNRWSKNGVLDRILTRL
jgi:hypothetical protein